MKFRHWVLPAVLAALAARAFMPAGYVAMASQGGISIATCSPDQTRRERIEIPGDQAPGEHRGLECKHCLSPVLGTPVAFLAVDSSPVTSLISGDEASQRAWLPLPRAQSARAPPRA